MADNKVLYKQILKSTALFGGVQVFNIVVSILRSKAIAIFIGPAGMGIAGLLNSTIDVIYSSTNLGLQSSGVKYISQANFNLEKKEVSKIVSILKQLMWITGIIGSILTIVFASWFSTFTFGNENFTWSFFWIASTLLFKNIANSHYAVLQGLGRLKDLAKANFYGSLLGLISTLPLYYYLGKDAIVPSIIISSILTMIIALFFSKKLTLHKVVVAKKLLFKEGKDLIYLGVMLSISGFMTTIGAYFLQIYISHTAGLNIVGFYIAATTLLNSYVGIIFTSMGTDYYPRLASISDDEEKVRTVVNHQAFIAILIITPLICLFIPLAPLIIKILYSSKFSAIIAMVSFGIVGMLFRTVSWSIGFILLAKGDSKIFVRTSLFFNSVFLLMNISAFYFWGIDGLGISFALYYLLHFFILKVLTYKIYNFYFDSEFYKLFSFATFICLAVLVVNYFEMSFFKAILMVLLISISIFYSVYQLNKKVDLLQIFNKLKK